MFGIFKKLLSGSKVVDAMDEQHGRGFGERATPPDLHPDPDKRPLGIIQNANRQGYRNLRDTTPPDKRDQLWPSHVVEMLESGMYTLQYSPTYRCFNVSMIKLSGLGYKCIDARGCGATPVAALNHLWTK